MDKTLISGKEAVEDRVSENDTSRKVQPDDEEMEETKTDSPTRTAEPDKADEELAERPWPDTVPQDGDKLCTLCGFLAKCPRSLKIHYARKHGKNSKNTDRTAKPAEEDENISDVRPAEVQQEMDMETESVKQNQESEPGPDSDDLKTDATDDGINAKGSTKREMALDKQAERRVSKRTPKPKMIYSCNYCGQEFRDKSPLDVHIQRYHTKDTPYTCEYLLFSNPVNVEIHPPTELMLFL